MRKKQLPYKITHAAAEGRLAVELTQPIKTGAHGMHVLPLDNGKAFLYAPPTYKADQPAALALMCHGAGGNAQSGLAPLLQLADSAGIVLLATSSRESTWDVIVGEYGPDVAFIDQALAETFSRYAIDPQHLAIGGFSDGASYALSLGIANGSLFSHIIAFSPGFMAPSQQEDAPRIFLSHGTRDNILPIDMCSRALVQKLQRASYDLTYHEFDGPHTVPPDIARAAVDWFLADKPA